MDKNDLKTLLLGGVFLVSFVKRDGSTRNMPCTLKLDLIPESMHPKNSIVKENESVLRVFDTENNGWRSIIIANISEVNPNE